MTVDTADRQSSDFWLFGYGSLIWKPPPHYDLRVPGYIEGYVRRFWQASEDHRGTPEAPGRVVTLIERQFWATLNDTYHKAEKRVWGTAYHIIPSKVKEVQEYLDIREINGCMVYIGLPNNPQFVGVQEPQALAEWICKSVGPSGPNKEYLLMLEESLLHLGKDSKDAHVSDLAVRVRRLEHQKTSRITFEEQVAVGVGYGSKHVGSVDEQEEIEKYARKSINLNNSTSI